MYQQTNKIRNNKNIQNKTDLKVNLQYNPNEIEEKKRNQALPTFHNPQPNALTSIHLTAFPPTKR